MRSSRGEPRPHSACLPPPSRPRSQGWPAPVWPASPRGLGGTAHPQLPRPHHGVSPRDLSWVPAPGSCMFRRWSRGARAAGLVEGEAWGAPSSRLPGLSSSIPLLPAGPPDFLPKPQVCGFQVNTPSPGLAREGALAVLALVAWNQHSQERQVEFPRRGGGGKRHGNDRNEIGRVFTHRAKVCVSGGFLETAHAL